MRKLPLIFNILLIVALFLDNIFLLKNIIIITTLFLLIFFIYTLYKKDLFFYKLTSNALKNLLNVLNKNSEKFSTITKLKYLPNKTKNIKKLFLIYNNMVSFYFDINILILIYGYSIGKLYEYLLKIYPNNIKFLINFYISSTLILIILILVLIKSFICLFSKAIKIIIKNRKKI